MNDRSPYNVLFLCTGNSARSIIAEAILSELGAGRFIAHSAGSHPKSTPNPHALTLLLHSGHDTSGLRSKSWDTFAAPGSPPLDFVFTLCDSAAGETCPFWPGQPMTAHWGLPDPAAVRGNDAEVAQAFNETYSALHRRIGAFVNLPFQSLDRLTLQAHLDDLGAKDRS